VDERRVVVKEPSNEVDTRRVASALQANKLKILELEAAEMLWFGGSNWRPDKRNYLSGILVITD